MIHLIYYKFVLQSFFINFFINSIRKFSSDLLNNQRFANRLRLHKVHQGLKKELIWKIQAIFEVELFILVAKKGFLMYLEGVPQVKLVFKIQTVNYFIVSSRYWFINFITDWTRNCLLTRIKYIQFLGPEDGPLPNRYVGDDNQIINAIHETVSWKTIKSKYSQVTMVAE